MSLSTLSGCSTSTGTGYIDTYESATMDSQNTVPDNLNEEQIWAKFDNLKEMFSDLTHPKLEDRINNTYAETFYFNDTLHSYSKREDLVNYLLKTAERIEATTTEFKEIAKSNESYYLRWTMHIEVKVLGKRVKTNSIGVSQIKFDEKGKIIFHQDFWDNTEGLFRHLPVVGYFVNKAKDRM